MKKWRKKSADQVSQFLAASLEKKKVSKKGPFSPYQLLEGLELYNRRVKGEEWEELKGSLCEELLLPKARKWAKSIFWIKRNFSARVFALKPLIQDESLILCLIDDSSFLVRSIASLAAIRLESKRGVFNTLQHMTVEAGYGKYYYCDLLSQGSNQIFVWVAEIAASHPRLHLACLEVLRMKAASALIPFLKEDFQSKQLNIREAALKIAVKYPQKGSVSLFLNCLKDPEKKIRALGAEGLGNYEEEASYKALAQAANDPSWDVRYECAKSLKKLGKIDLLKDREMTQYVKEF